MPRSVLLDAGPLVAYLREAETHHGWAVEQFKRFTQLEDFSIYRRHEREVIPFLSPRN